MKRVIYLTTAVIVLAALALTGCAPKSAQATNSGVTPGGPNMAPLTQDYANALPVLNQLVVGTFKLEDTEHAVDAAQATELLPLWKAYRNMDNSTSSSPVEVQALLKQLRGAMTEEQLNAIAAMKLTGEDMRQLIQERGIDITRSDDTKGPTASRASERPAIGGGGPGGGGGGAPGSGGGGMPGGGGGMPAGGEIMPGMPGEGTPGAEQQSMGARAVAVPAPLYGALIELLKSKV